MAFIGEFNIDENYEERPAGGYALVPDGKYNATIETTDVVPTKNKLGTRITGKVKISNGTYAGQILFFNINIQNPNPDAERIGKRQFASLCSAVGKRGTIKDTILLHGKTVGVRVKVKQSEGYDPKSEVVDFFPPTVSEIAKQVEAVKAQAASLTAEEETWA